MVITWRICATYEEAMNFTRCIYLFEWNGQAHYWGKVGETYFGGRTRDLDGRNVTPRYSAGYRHLIEGGLDNGCRLYIGVLNEEAYARIDDVEQYLIHTFGHVANRRIAPECPVIFIEQLGNLPISIADQ